jgi:hypothetical protein
MIIWTRGLSLLVFSYFGKHVSFGTIQYGKIEAYLPKTIQL